MPNRLSSSFLRWLSGVGAAVRPGAAGRGWRDTGEHRRGTAIRNPFSADARKEPVTGRVYVAISKVNTRPPIDQTSPTGVPLFAVGVENLAPGQAAVIDATTFGHPVQSLRDIPAGDYWVQPFVNVYTKFVRADGHTVWLHMDQWEGQNWKRSPGNITGDAGAGPLRSGVVRADRAGRRSGHSADSAAGRHRHRRSTSSFRARF